MSETKKRHMTKEDFESILPIDLRDFHDQKDIFKTIHGLYQKNNKIPCTWVDGHVYTIDFFLWFMAQHGYRLQKFKSRHFQQFDLQASIDHFKEQQNNILVEILKKSSPES